MRLFSACFLARLVVTSAFVGASALGCANRGMVSPEETGSGGGSQLGGSGGTTSLGGHGGGTGGSAGGKGGGSGGSGGAKMDAGCSLVTDALFDHSTTACGALFNFEGSTEKATLIAGGAFTGVSQGTTPHTYCGSGSLAIAAAFSGTSGALVKGEVDIPLGVDGGSMDLSGKTLTVHVAASPAACGEDLRFQVVLDTTAGAPVALNISALTTNFTTASKSLATVAGASATNRIALLALSATGYTGTIYVDEIDLK